MQSSQDTTKETYLVLIEHKIFSENIRMAETLEHCVHETAKIKQKNHRCFHHLSNLEVGMLSMDACLPCISMIFQSSDTGHLIRWPYVAAKRRYSSIQRCRLLRLCERNKNSFD